ncbi:MAG TPA: insulinase family protein, partial [Chitinophagales bacterium]|nr:insulinase family protein [Chitinophagales bacterium]
MIKFATATLQNGLKIVVHEDPTTPLAVFNLLYDVGSRDEEPIHTGFAHLFEHLMFAGSANVPDFEQPLYAANGESNAYTSSDFTNFYAQLPAQNIETAFWIESDRMLA